MVEVGQVDASPPEVSPSFRTRVRTKLAANPGRAFLLTVVAVFAVFIAVRLGPALLGLRVFAPADLLSTLHPWWNVGPKPSVLNVGLGDSINATLPAYIQIHDRLWNGDIPLWSSLAGPGNGMLATTIKPTISLSNFWFLLLPTGYAAGMAQLFTILVAFLGMTFWLRQVGVRTYAAAAAGLLYCGSGFLTAWATWPAQASVAALIPGIFWGVELILAKRTARSGLPLAALVAFQLLGGFPGVVAYTLYAAAAYFVVRLIADWAKHPANRNVLIAVLTAGIVLLGFALAAIQLLPFLNGLSDTDLSYRGNRFYTKAVGRSFLSLFFPETFFDAGYNGRSKIESYSFVGLGAAILALIAALTPRVKGLQRGVTTFLAIALLFSLLMVWRQGWYTNWLAEFPGFKQNGGGRMRSLVDLFACALAGIGLHRIFATKPSKSTRIAILAIAGGSLLIAAVCYLVTWQDLSGSVNGGIFASDAFWGLGTAAVIVVAVVVAANRKLRFATFTALIILVGVQAGNSVSNYWPLSDPDDFFPELALTNAAVDIVGHGRMTSPSAFMGSSAAAYGIRSISSHNFQPVTWADMITSLDDDAYTGNGRSVTLPSIGAQLIPTPVESTLLDRFGINVWYGHPGRQVPGNFRTLDGLAAGDGKLTMSSTITAAANQPVETVIAAQPIRGILVALAEPAIDRDQGVKISAQIIDPATNEILASGAYVRPNISAAPFTIAIAGEHLANHRGELKLSVQASVPVEFAGNKAGKLAAEAKIAVDDGVHLVFSDDHGTLWTRDSALPRIRWANATEVIVAKDQRLARLADPALPKGTVVLDAEGPQPSGPAMANIDILDDSGDYITARVTAPDSGYLVVADWMQSGWQVSVDGVTATLVNADHAFSGVFVPAGDHTIRFEFVGKHLTSGIYLTAGALLVVLGILVFPWARRRFGWWQPKPAATVESAHGDDDTAAVTDDLNLR